jgi:hypothetical protein
MGRPSVGVGEGSCVTLIIYLRDVNKKLPMTRYGARQMT